MQLNKIKRYEIPSSSPSTGGVSSVNGMSGDVVIGNVGGLTCYVNALGGNDATAEAGNPLRPFQTLHGAVYAVQSGGLIEVFAGTYYEDDNTLPLGLLINSYDFYFHPNAIVHYYGNYGLYISSSWIDGNIYGYGKFYTYAPTFTNFSGAAIWVEIYSTQKLFEFVFIVSAYDSSETDSILLHIGTCANTGTIWTFSNRILSRRGTTILINSGARCTFAPTTGFIQNTGNKPAIVMNNPTEASFINLPVNGYGNSFGRNQPKLVTIYAWFNTQKISFRNCTVYYISDMVSYRLIEFLGTVDAWAGVTFKDCLLINSSESSTAPKGNSIFTYYPINVRIMNTYASAATGGSGAITNLITQGNKLMIDPNVKL